VSWDEEGPDVDDDDFREELSDDDGGRGKGISKNVLKVCGLCAKTWHRHV